MSAGDLADLLARADGATFIGQRAGAFELGRVPEGAAAAWSSGRCFNSDFEIRWWPDDDGARRSVLILNGLPPGWVAPEGWERREPLAEAPAEVGYVCVGEYDREAPEGVHRWWETRYGRCFEYLDSAPPASGRRGGRVVLRAFVYELEDGRTQHRLMGFQHATAEATGR